MKIRNFIILSLSSVASVVSGIDASNVDGAVTAAAYKQDGYEGVKKVISSLGMNVLQNVGRLETHLDNSLSTGDTNNVRTTLNATLVAPNAILTCTGFAAKQENGKYYYGSFGQPPIAGSIFYINKNDTYTVQKWFELRRDDYTLYLGILDKATSMPGFKVNEGALINSVVGVVGSSSIDFTGDAANLSDHLNYDSKYTGTITVKPAGEYLIKGKDDASTTNYDVNLSPMPANATYMPDAGGAFAVEGAGSERPVLLGIATMHDVHGQSVFINVQPYAARIKNFLEN